MPLPKIPEKITVHLGKPNEDAENLTLPFAKYIKNVASSEIYPTWPESAVRANILAQISFTLNRVYTEYYRSRGYAFDITSTTQYDHAFVPNREIFENISRITDDIFNDYIVRQGSVEPLFAQFCDGIKTQCGGLSQWGSVELAEKGLGPYEILQSYYGKDINIVFDAPVGSGAESYPGAPLERGDFGEDVRTVKRQLNRIGKNYPALPVIENTDAAFGIETENAVKEFQRIFNLSADGIVGKATWYKMKEIYGGVKKLSELTSEGITISEVQREFPKVLQLGDSGIGVRAMQYYLAYLGYFLPEIPLIKITGVFDSATKEAVIAFQRLYGISPDGIVGRNTWNYLQWAYSELINNLPEDYRQFADEIYPGKFILPGDTGSEVTVIQENLVNISRNDPAIPFSEVTGTFDAATENAVKAIQKKLGFEESGVVGPVLWSYIITKGSGF